MANQEGDKFGRVFGVGDVVYVRCTVTAITPSSSPVTPPPALRGGSGDRITCVVQNNGNIGEVSGVSSQISPIQCFKTGDKSQL